MSANTPHDVGPQADVAHEIEQQIREAGGAPVVIRTQTLVSAVRLLNTLRGEGVAEGEARSARALEAAQAKLTAVIEIVARIEAHEPSHSYARRVLARDLRDALGLGDVQLRVSAGDAGDARNAADCGGECGIDHGAEGECL